MKLNFKNHTIKLRGSDENPLFDFRDIVDSLGHEYAQQCTQFIHVQCQIEIWTCIDRQIYLTEFGLYKYLFQDNSDVAAEFQLHIMQLLKALRLGQIQLEFLSDSDIKQSIQQNPNCVLNQIIDCGLQQKIKEQIIEYQSLSNLKQLNLLTGSQLQQFEQLNRDIQYDCFQFNRYYEGYQLTPENWNPNFDIYY